MYHRDSETLFFLSTQRDQEVSTKPSQLVAHTAGHRRCCRSVSQLFSVTISTAVSKYLKQQQQINKQTKPNIDRATPWESLTEG